MMPTHLSIACLVIGLAPLAFAQETCETHPNDQCPAGAKAYVLEQPDYGCPVNICAYSMPAASVDCEAGLCTAYPQGVSSPLSYYWSTSNSEVGISPVGEELIYSCTRNQSALITVTVSDGNSYSTAYASVFCRPNNGSGGAQQ